MSETSPTGRLGGRKALITGASRSIGRAIALRFAAEGAGLFLVATGLEQLQGTRTAVEALGVRAPPTPPT